MLPQEGDFVLHTVPEVETEVVDQPVQWLQSKLNRERKDNRLESEIADQPTECLRAHD
jgi:hypothetical protein